ncbi:ADP-ribose pyrophosphatase [Salipaludibacillus keqinensis]|uniref:ADP-ribose pyrophosphatase n=1 Tax=Salipaludibacillus keqinensis TaxID=2045207 RepID=A0A323TDA9_9BACI|nr:NUDIX hydrolase [Salipaludibacillus keqinensis]PYZ93362.1 ADP-ribose pyrophosphatase [Salipaludibacillus keqinensis]
MSYQWLDWAKRIQALSQSGLAFSKDKYDIERYKELRKISAEIIAEHTNLPMKKIPELFMNETGYQTPKVDVRGAVFKEDKILMVKEKHDDKWSLPGGFCDVGLSPSENIVKEIKEESGYRVDAKKLVALLDMEKHSQIPQPYHYYKIFIQCELVGGHAKSGIETKGVKFFSENKLPKLSTKRNTEAQIQMLFEFMRNPQKVCVFD